VHTQSLSSKLNKALISTGRNLFCQYFIMFILLLCSVCLYGIYRIRGFVVYPDEFGYWASAAKNIGYDWTEVASLGSYYSFGYSLLLTPILWIFKGGVAAYRAAVIVNLMLQCASVCLIFGIFRRLYPREDALDIIYAVGIGVMYPVWMFYVQTTLCETLITFMYILICYLFLRVLQTPKVYFVIGLIVSIIYIVFVHMRTVGLAIAAVMVLVLWAWKNPKMRKFIALGLLIAIAGAVAGIVIKSGIVSSVYGDADKSRLEGNTFAGQIVAIRQILTMEGMVRLLRGSAAKLYYLGAASFGLFYIAIISLLKNAGRLIASLFKGRKIDWTDLFEAFLLLSFLGQFGITTIYMNKPARLDEIFYGRYNEYLLPILMGIGLIELKRCKHIIIYVITEIIISGLLVWIGVRFAVQSGTTGIEKIFLTGISYLFDGNNISSSIDFYISFIFATELMIIVALCVWGCDGKKRRNIFLICILALEVTLGIIINTQNTYVSADIDRSDLKVATYIETHGSESKPVQYLAMPDRPFIDLIQFDLKDRSIDVIWNEGEIVPGYLIVDIDSPYRDKFDLLYNLKQETHWFALYKTE